MFVSVLQPRRAVAFTALVSFPYNFPDLTKVGVAGCVLDRFGVDQWVYKLRLADEH